VKHREFLETYLNGGFREGTLRLTEVVDYKIVEHLEDEPEAQKDAQGPLSPKKAFLIAAKRESASHEFYKELSLIHPPGQVRDLLLRMANEELRHKEKVEYLYANAAFPQTAGG
jgi:rubrerythrin